MKSQFILSAALAIFGLATTSYAGGFGRDRTNAVFVMTNSADRNEVWAYQRLSTGGLALSGRFDTLGRGSGGKIDPLGSQGSLVLSQNRDLLFAVNAGSGNVSVFQVNGPLLQLLHIANSGGSAPVAIAEWNNLVYVLNFAGNSNVVGFRFDYLRGLVPIPNSIRYLSAANSGASSIAFSPDGNYLLVTEKLTNNIDVFPVGNDGALAPAVIHHDPVPGTFAVRFAPDGAALVVETGPAGGMNASAISSFSLGVGGVLTPLSTNVPTLGAGTCWNAVTPDGRFVYTANSATSSVSGFSITGPGSLSPLSGTVQASFAAGSTNLDMDISSDGKYLYTLNTGNGSIGVLSINPDGSLTPVSSQAGIVPASGFNGLAVY